MPGDFLPQLPEDSHGLVAGSETAGKISFEVLRLMSLEPELRQIKVLQEFLQVTFEIEEIQWLRGVVHRGRASVSAKTQS